jgi:sec-independent protein translocase protein TatB
MFDVGFSELLVIGVVALLVLGPERLPKLARDVGRWLGRARRYVNRVREEIDREVELSELRRLRDEIEAKAREAAAEVDAAGEAVEQAARSTLDDVAQPVPKGQEAAAVSDAGKGAKKPPRKRVSKAAISAEAGAPSGAEAGSVRKRAPRAARKPAEST